MTQQRKDDEIIYEVVIEHPDGNNDEFRTFKNYPDALAFFKSLEESLKNGLFEDPLYQNYCRVRHFWIQDRDTGEVLKEHRTRR